MAKRPILYSFRRCPYAMRARMALDASGLDYEHREILLRNKPPSMLAYSPKGTVPVLCVGTQVLDESIDIMKWALAHSDPELWLQPGTDTRKSTDTRQALTSTSPGARTDEQSHRLPWELIAENDDSFKKSLDRYKYHTRHPEKSQQEYRNDAEAFLLRLEQCLGSHDGKGLCAARTSLADIAIFPFIRQFSKVEPAWFATHPYGRLRNWLAKLEASPRFTRIMKKHPLWVE